MRVRVSYGVDLEELPKISEDLLLASIQRLQNSLTILERSLEELKDSDKDYSATSNIIDKARIELSKSDLTLSDIQSILMGLNRHYNGEENVPEGRPTMDTSGNANEQTSHTGKG